MEFIDREKELAFLEGKWKDQGPQLIILWGKRRIGKTELVKQFIKDKPHVYFLSESTSELEQLRRFSFAMGQFFKEPLLTTLRLRIQLPGNAWPRPWGNLDLQINYHSILVVNLKERGYL